MKKIVMILFTSFLLTACMNNKSIPIKSAQEAVTMIENKETMIMVIGSTTCLSCKEFDSVIEEFVKNYDVNIIKVYIDDEDFVEVDGEKKRVHFAKLEEKVGTIKNTPTILFIRDGEVKGLAEGSISYSTFKTKVVEYGFIE